MVDPDFPERLYYSSDYSGSVIAESDSGNVSVNAASPEQAHRHRFATDLSGAVQNVIWGTTDPKFSQSDADMASLQRILAENLSVMDMVLESPINRATRVILAQSEQLAAQIKAAKDISESVSTLEAVIREEFVDYDTAEHFVCDVAVDTLRQQALTIVTLKADVAALKNHLGKRAAYKEDIHELYDVMTDEFGGLNACEGVHTAAIRVMREQRAHVTNQTDKLIMVSKELHEALSGIHPRQQNHSSARLVGAGGTEATVSLIELDPAVLESAGLLVANMRLLGRHVGAKALEASIKGAQAAGPIVTIQWKSSGATVNLHDMDEMSF